MADKFIKRLYLIFLLSGFYVVGAAVMCLCYYAVYRMTGEGVLGDGALLVRRSAVLLGLLSARVVTLSYYVTAIFFLIMLYNAADEAARFKTPFTYCSPGMAAGCWFIPFANLVMPYLVMRNLLRSAADSTDQRRRDLLVSLWWAAFLAKGLYGTGIFLMRTFATDQKPDIGYLSIEIILDGILMLLASGLFLWMLYVWKDMHVTALPVEDHPVSV
jgi:hypothetical protein